MRMADTNEDVRVVFEHATNSEDPQLRTYVSTTYEDDSSSFGNSREEDKQLPQTEFKKKKILIGVLCCITIFILCNIGFFYLIGAKG